MTTASQDYEDLITALADNLQAPRNRDTIVAGLPDQNAVYRGLTTPADQVVVIEQPGADSPPKPLPHLVRHSPAGLHWGYHGNGPRDLALSLLADTLGDIATCTVSSQGPQHTACGCWDGLRPLPYLRFTTDLIAHLPMYHPWALSRWDITTWLLNLADRPIPDLGQPAAGNTQ